MSSCVRCRCPLQREVLKNVRGRESHARLHVEPTEDTCPPRALPGSPGKGVSWPRIRADVGAAAQRMRSCRRTPLSRWTAPPELGGPLAGNTRRPANTRAEGRAARKIARTQGTAPNTASLRRTDEPFSRRRTGGQDVAQENRVISTWRRAPLHRYGKGQAHGRTGRRRKSGRRAAEDGTTPGSCTVWAAVTAPSQWHTNGKRHHHAIALAHHARRRPFPTTTESCPSARLF